MHTGVIATGLFYSGSINVIYKPNRIDQSHDARKFIELRWLDFVKRNPKAYNGVLLRVDSYDTIKSNLIELHFSDTDYKEFVGTRDHEFIKRFGPEKTANPLSVGAVLVTKDNKIILGKRARGVDIGKYKISVVGGYLDPKKDFVNIAAGDYSSNGRNIDIFSAIKREIYEETGIASEDIVRLICLGLINNKEQNQINAPFYCKLGIFAKEIEIKQRHRETEFSQMIMIDNSVQSIDNFKNSQENNLSRVLVPTLNMYNMCKGDIIN